MITFLSQSQINCFNGKVGTFLLMQNVIFYNQLYDIEIHIRSFYVRYKITNRSNSKINNINVIRLRKKIYRLWVIAFYVIAYLNKNFSMRNTFSMCTIFILHFRFILHWNTNIYEINLFKRQMSHYWTKVYHRDCYAAILERQFLKLRIIDNMNSIEN